MKIFHLDMNSAAFRPETLRQMIAKAAQCGFDRLLFEIENKVKWETCPECVDPEAMTKDELDNLLKYARSLGLEPIPLLQSFGHAEYVLTHPEYFRFRELPEFYDCYCPSKPELRRFLSRWIAEYLELFGPIEMFHLGGDEAYHLGKCPVCSGRDRLELYASHLSELAAPLIRRGVRPAIWHDVVSGDSWWTKPEKRTSAPLDKDFSIWVWDYRGSGDDFKACRTVRELGFDAVAAASVQAYGDDPFTVRCGLHARNLQNAIAAAPDVCVTSWSVRMALKQLQYPILEAFGSGDWSSLPAPLEAAGTWCDMTFGSGVMNTPYKDWMLPPPDFLKHKLAENSRQLPEWRAKLDRVLAELPESLPDPVWNAALDLKRRWIQLLQKAVSGDLGLPDLKAAENLRDALQNHYATEQLPASAAHNAHLVLNPLVDYCRSL